MGMIVSQLHPLPILATYLPLSLIAEPENLTLLVPNLTTVHDPEPGPAVSNPHNLLP